MKEMAARHFPGSKWKNNNRKRIKKLTDVNRGHISEYPIHFSTSDKKLFRLIRMKFAYPAALCTFFDFSL